MLNLDCPTTPHKHYYVDEESGYEYIIPESFVQKVKDELLGLYRKIGYSAEEEKDDMETPSD